jgi:NAD(P)-dependent dehydrogenase (short-subunit alcohol dehydrogenase family)
VILPFCSFSEIVILMVRSKAIIKMARIFITGSSDGLGQLAAKELIAQGHKVAIHGRNEERSKQAIDKLPGAETVLTADLTHLKETILLGEAVNALGSFDAIIHNAGVYNSSGKELFAVNTLAPYVLTCLIQKPERIIYLSSDMHNGGQTKMESLRSDLNNITYSDTKLHVLMLCKAVARKWKDVFVNAVNPGWVPTKMGGSGAPDDLKKGFETQTWLAVSNDEKVKVSGRYFYHQKESRYNKEADDLSFQEEILQVCAKITGISFPEK